MVSGSLDKTCKIWDLKMGLGFDKGKSLDTLTRPSAVTTVSFYEDRLAAGCSDGSISVWESFSSKATNAVVLKHDVGQVLACQLTSNSLYSVGSDGKIYIHEFVPK